MTAVVQRPLKGSRRSHFYPDKSLPSLSSLDSAFQLQEYISLLIRLDIHDVEAIVSVPDTSSGKEGAEVKENGDEKEGEKESKSDFAVDKACWIYEQLRRLAQDLSYPLITLLQQECTRTTCPEMKAGEWQYLCVAHGTDGAMEQCCAIDYILHTIDSATGLLNSPKAFPSRISIPSASHRHFNSLARRLSRIFAHAYFHHREVFEQAEADSSLYARFLALIDKFDLVPREFLVIPTPVLEHEHEHEHEPPRILAATAPQNAYAQQEQQEDHMGGDRGHGTGDPFESSTSPTESGLGHGAPLAEASPQRNPSPWKGRSRTDTMVHSEAFILAEELAKNEDAEEPRSLVGDSDSSSGSSSEDEQPQEIVILPPPEASPLAVEEASPVIETQAQEEGEKEHVVEQVHEEEEAKETDEAEDRGTEADSPVDEFSSVDPALARESEEVPSDPPSAQPEPLDVPTIAEEVDAPTSPSEPEPSPAEPLVVPIPSTQPEDDIIPAPEEPVALDEASAETTEEPAPEPVEAVISETAVTSVDAVDEPTAAEEPLTATIEKTSLPLQIGESEDATGDVAEAEAGPEPEPEPSSEDIKDLEEVDLNDVETKHDEGQVEEKVVEDPGVTEDIDRAEPAHAEHARETEIKTEEPLEKTELVALVGETTVELDESEVSFILKDQDEDEVHAEAESAPP